MGGWISTDRAQASHKSWSVDFVLNLSIAAFDPFLYSHLWLWYFILWPTQDGQEPPTYFPRFQNNVCKPRTRTKQKRSGVGRLFDFSPAFCRDGPSVLARFPVIPGHVVLGRFLLYAKFLWLWCYVFSKEERSRNHGTSEKQQRRHLCRERVCLPALGRAGRETWVSPPWKPLCYGFPPRVVETSILSV